LFFNLLESVGLCEFDKLVSNLYECNSLLCVVVLVELHDVGVPLHEIVVEELRLVGLEIVVVVRTSDAIKHVVGLVLKVLLLSTVSISANGFIALLDILLIVHNVLNVSSKTFLLFVQGAVAEVELGEVEVVVLVRRCLVGCHLSGEYDV